MDKNRIPHVKKRDFKEKSVRLLFLPLVGVQFTLDTAFENP